MAQKFIEWTETAIQQRRSILKYWTIRNGSPDYALKIIRLSEQHTESILKNPSVSAMSPLLIVNLALHQFMWDIAVKKRRANSVTHSSKKRAFRFLA